MNIIEFFKVSHRKMKIVSEENIEALKKAPEVFFDVNEVKSSCEKFIKGEGFYFSFKNYNRSNWNRVEKKYNFINKNNKKVKTEFFSMITMGDNDCYKMESNHYKYITSENSIIPFIMDLFENFYNIDLLHNLFFENYLIEETDWYENFLNNYGNKKQNEIHKSFFEDAIKNFKNNTIQYFSTKDLYKIGLFNINKSNSNLNFWKKNKKNVMSVIINFNEKNIFTINDSSLKKIHLNLDEKTKKWYISEMIFNKFFNDKKSKINLSCYKGVTEIKEAKRNIYFKRNNLKNLSMLGGPDFRKINLLRSDEFSIMVNKIKLPEIFRYFDLPVEITFGKDYLEYFYNPKKVSKSNKKNFENIIKNFTDKKLINSIRFLLLMPKNKYNKKTISHLNKLSPDWKSEDDLEDIFNLLIMSDNYFNLIYDFYFEAENFIKGVEKIYNRYKKESVANKENNKKMINEILKLID